jgi:hypothetical protein
VADLARLDSAARRPDRDGGIFVGSGVDTHPSSSNRVRLDVPQCRRVPWRSIRGV